MDYSPSPKSCRLIESLERQTADFVRYELRYSAEDGVHISDKERRLLIRADFCHVVEICLGTPVAKDQSRLFLLHGSECGQLGAEFILVQPEVVAADPRRGWLPLGELHPAAQTLGTEDSPEFDWGIGVSPDHGRVSVSEEGIWISDGSNTKTEVRAHPDDVILWSR